MITFSISEREAARAKREIAQRLKELRQIGHVEVIDDVMGIVAEVELEGVRVRIDPLRLIERTRARGRDFLTAPSRS